MTPSEYNRLLRRGRAVSRVLRRVDWSGWLTQALATVVVIVGTLMLVGMALDVWRAW